MRAYGATINNVAIKVTAITNSCSGSKWCCTSINASISAYSTGVVNVAIKVCLPIFDNENVSKTSSR